MSWKLSDQRRTAMTLSITYVNIGDLEPYENNSRTHSAAQITQIADSINEFGFTNPLLIDENGGIIAGHGRLMAAQKLNLEEVPAIVLSDLTDAQKQAYVIADNKLALNAGWDNDLLKYELEKLAELNFDLELTGFVQYELANLFDDDIQPNESKTQEIDVDSFTADHQCPKCGFEFND